jgi:hypothetical protein
LDFTISRSMQPRAAACPSLITEYSPAPAEATPSPLCVHGKAGRDSIDT